MVLIGDFVPGALDGLSTFDFILVIVSLNSVWVGSGKLVSRDGIWWFPIVVVTFGEAAVGFRSVGDCDGVECGVRCSAYRGSVRSSTVGGLSGDQGNFGDERRPTRSQVRKVLRVSGTDFESLGTARGRCRVG